MTAVRSVFVGLIRCYQAVVSPLLGPRCRFHPTCSSYMSEAVTRHGVLRGVWLGLSRLVRCHPWSEGGLDPVPEPEPSNVDACCSPANAKIEP